MSQASPSRPRTASTFVEPTTLGAFNERLEQLGLPGPLSPPEHRLLLEKYPKANVLRALIHIHNGGNGSVGARVYMTKAIDDTRHSMAEGQGPRSDRPEFIEPTTLGTFNGMLTRMDLSRALSKAELDVLLQNVGRAELVSALRDVHVESAERDAAEAMLRRELATAIVRVARGDGAVGQAPFDELPPEDDTDTGFTGIAESQRQPPPPASAPHRESSRPEGGAPRTGTNHGPARGSAPATPAHGGRTDGKDDRFQARAYGKRAALCVEALDDGSQDFTVMVEMAPAVENREKEYDWKNRKMRFMLMRKELPALIAVLYGWADSVEFANHGESKVKSLTLINQEGGKLYMKLSDKGAPMLVLPITEVDSLLSFTSLALTQTCKSYRMGSSELLTWIRSRLVPNIRPAPQGQRQSS